MGRMKNARAAASGLGDSRGGRVAQRGHAPDFFMLVSLMLVENNLALVETARSSVSSDPTEA